MPPLTLQRERKQARYFTEPLALPAGALPLDLVLVPGGTFMMGSPDEEPDRSNDEGPRHEVSVPAFFMGRYPVTQAQYECVLETNPATQYDSERFVAPNKPVVGVSWHNAVQFCQRLSQLTERSYRLPSEAEWEYACRAGTETPFAFGPILTTEVANYNGTYTYNGSPKGPYRAETTPVDAFPVANGFGLWDMHGNVWEWCQDHYHSSYDQAPTDGRAWEDEGAKENASRVRRGGSWFVNPRYCRSAYRTDYFPRGSNDDLGFRVVCVAPRVLQ